MAIIYTTLQHVCVRVREPVYVLKVRTGNETEDGGKRLRTEWKTGEFFQTEFALVFPPLVWAGARRGDQMPIRKPSFGKIVKRGQNLNIKNFGRVTYKLATKFLGAT